MQLTDLTLMAMPWRDKPNHEVKRMYEALLQTGALVQVPAVLIPMLKCSLDKRRTVVALNLGDTAEPGYAGYLCRENVLCPFDTIKECAPYTKSFPQADRNRVIVDSSLFLLDYEKTFHQIRRHSPKPVTLCAKGSTSLATALTVDWLLCHSPFATVSFLGCGGYASLADVMMVLSLNGYKGFSPEALPLVAKAWDEIFEKSIPPHQPVVGKQIFDVSSGVHINGILKDNESYEPFAPEAVGLARRIVLGKHSGTSAILTKLDSIGYSHDRVDVSRLLNDVRALGEAQGEVPDHDFLTLVRKAEKGLSV